MKNADLKLGIILFTLIFSICMNAQHNLPLNVRDKYVAQKYSFSTEQVRTYNQRLLIAEAARRKLKDQKMSVANRKKSENKISSELCIAVKKILPNSQYDTWYANHKGNLLFRQYKEDFGMTDSQYLQYQNCAKLYSKEKEKITKMNISGSEQKERRTHVFNTFCTSLRTIFTMPIAEYLINENLIQNMATNISKKYTIISETKAIQYSILKIQYEKDLELLNAQMLDSKNKRKNRKKIKEKYEYSIKSLLTDEEYIKCTKRRDQLTDQRMLRTYKLSEEQLSQYKELRKKLSMQQLKIKQSKNKRSDRIANLQKVEIEFEASLKKIIGSQQFEVWKKDHLIKRNQKIRK